MRKAYHSAILINCVVAFLALSLLGTSIPLNAQNDYGHAWIDPAKDYLKFEIEKSGIYRIMISDIKTAGFPINYASASQIQLFSMGKEVPIRISSDSLLRDSDYIEFYAESNTGEIDSFLYQNPSKDQLNPRFSLYTNQRPYYLCLSNSGSTRRFKNISNGLHTNNLPSPEEYYIHRESREYGSFHFKPTYNGRDFIRYSSFGSAEGFGSELKHDREVIFPISHVSASGPKPKLILRFGTNSASRQLQVFVNDIPVRSVSQSGYGVVQLDLTLEYDMILSNELRVRIKALGDQNEKHSLSFIELQYPRKYDFGSKSEFRFLEQASILPRRVDILNYGGSKPIMYNLSDDTYLYPQFFLGVARFISPASLEKDSWIIADETDIQTIHKLTLRNFKSFNSGKADYLIITDKQLNKSNAVNAYANYRRSDPGGAYNVDLNYIDDISDLFGYGLKDHPIGLINYFHFLESQEQLPRFIFLIGKAREYPEIRLGKVENNFVPTFGTPGSDNLLLSDLKSYPHIAIGRLAVQKAEQVLDYLNKIQLQENSFGLNEPLENQKWKKTIVHLSGGSSDIQQLLYGYLNNMSEVISRSRFSGDVYTFRKTSSDPLQKSLSEEIIEKLNSGAALLTFFGHSAVGTFDFSLENPSKYSNTGKNPVILSLGCHSGNIFTGNTGISEEFVLQKGSGAIAFLASSGTAYITPQYEMGMNIYEAWSEEMYGKPIGEVVSNAIASKTSDEHIAIKTLLEQLTLHGDPAYALRSFKGPDYHIDAHSVQIAGEPVELNSDSIYIQFDILNSGSSSSIPLDISLKHLLPDANVFSDNTVSVVLTSYRTTLKLSLPNPGFKGIGSNKILLELNRDRKVLEYPDPIAFSNNSYWNDLKNSEGYPFQIVGNTAKPISPQNFSILNEEAISLRIAVGNPFQPKAKFIVQIDTTELYNSPLLTEEIIESSSSTIDWYPQIDRIKKTVYYWRVSLVPPGDVLKDNYWSSYSFLYDPQSDPGWNQSHHFQWLKNDFNRINLSGNRDFEFTQRIWDIRIKNELRDPQDFWVFVNNTPWASLNPKSLAPGLAIFAWLPDNRIFENKGRDFGSMAFSKDCFIYRMDKLADRKNIKLLLDAIPKGSKVFLYTILAAEDSSIFPEQWASDKNILGYDLYEVLESYGARKIRGLQLRGTVPYSFIFEKGKGLVIEDIANNIQETIDLSSKVEGHWEEGSLNSVRIGPVSRWMRLLWNEEKTTGDSSEVKIFGISTSGKKELLRTIRSDYNVNLTNINPEKYPYLELEYYAKDNSEKSCPQLRFWKILFKELPDLAFRTDITSPKLPDSLDAGEELSIPFKVQNLSQTPIEDYLVRYSLLSESNERFTYLFRSERIAGLSIAEIKHQIKTVGLGGLYTVEVELNSIRDPEESEYCNNYASFPLFIRPDKKNPILDVRFDGRIIANGELVRDNPEIRISLRDFDSQLLLDNPEDFDIKLFYPQVLVWKPRIGLPNVRFVPASSLNNNYCSFILNPRLNLDGIYRLEVQAKDRAGNLAGDQPYAIKFRVGDSFRTNEPFRIYPNPVSELAQIEYFLDSERVPEIFELNIFSADGRLVRRFDRNDFGGLFPGLNQLQWRRQDFSGNRLPHGIYYYELITDIDSRDSKKKGSILLVD